ncbi:MAG: hypothetical protein F2793_00820 [Actinobacteria bacterium]|uniref:Unannotated protein n=1 Tax=freshwater metagenome TaxID=449393 RepID=A0A6J7CTC0_9ZZZZ|nr:hypothetical protein [Actinomycetota bacterium]
MNSVVTLVGAGLVLLPGAPLVPILVTTQVVNSVLLLPILAVACCVLALCVLLAARYTA